MGIKEKLPLINSDKKGIRIAGYIIYAFIFLNVLGAILPAPDSSETEAGSIKDQSAEVVPNTVDEWYTAAVSIDPQNEDDARKKIEYFQHVLDVDPNNLSALWGTALTYRYNLEDETKGLEYLDTILKLQPRNTYFLDKKSSFLEDSGNTEEALAIQDEIISIATDGKPFSDNEWGDEAEECNELLTLSHAWTAKSPLAVKLRLGPGVGPEYVEKGRGYSNQWNKCKGYA